MTEEELATIESALGIELPPDYRELVCPLMLRGYEGNTHTPLWDDARKLIELNRRERRSGRWPEHFFVIGEEPDNSKTAIDLTTINLDVWWMDGASTSPGPTAGPEGLIEWSLMLLHVVRNNAISPAPVPRAAKEPRSISRSPAVRSFFTTAEAMVTAVVLLLLFAALLSLLLHW